MGSRLEGGEGRGPEVMEGKEGTNRDTENRGGGGEGGRRPRSRKRGRGGWGPYGGGDGALGGVEFASKTGGERSRDRGEGFQKKGGRGEDGKIINVGTQPEGRGEGEKGPDKKVKDKKEEIGRDGAALTNTRHSKKGARGAIGEGKVGGGWGEDVGDVVV